MRSRQPRALVATCVLGATFCASAPRAAAADDPWLDVVADFSPGTFSGFGADRLPRVALGPPRGGGLLKGSVHVISLGHGGTITVAFRDNVVVDGPGADLVIYENAFHSGSEQGPVFTELGIVEVSADGKTWNAFPYEAETGEGLAGRTPVLSAPSNEIDPFAPEGGGDRFDIGELGLDFVRFVRVTDGGDALPDAGDLAPPADKGGFDLDAMGALNSAEPGIVRGTVTSGGAPVADARVRLRSSDGARTVRRRTREDGAFRFRPVLPSGLYHLIANSPAVGHAERDVEVDQDSLVVDVELQLE
jgi:hypothetical protein